MPEPAPQHRPRRVLVTGGAGFIGGAYVRLLLDADADASVVTFDALTYAGDRAYLDELDARHPGRHRLVVGDIADHDAVASVFAEFAPDTVVHIAAESHVDRSIDGPAAFVRSNVVGTFTLLETARRAWRGRSDVRFHHVGTDEVYGSVADGRAVEGTAYDPSSPYSATKAAADHLVRAWHRTYGLPVTLSIGSNTFGPRQFPEKLVPLMTRTARDREPLPLFGDGEQSRDWLPVEDHCRAIDAIVRRGVPGRTYHVAGGCERRNREIVERICDLVDAALRDGGPPRRALIASVADRPGHDRRYAIDGTRIAEELGWRPSAASDDALAATVAWYLENESWSSRMLARAGYDGSRLGRARA